MNWEHLLYSLQYSAKPDGLSPTEGEPFAYIITDQGRDFIAFSNICTHLGCRVRWINDQEQFFCPCHNAVFDQNGEVESGPPPRALDRFEVKVEDGQVYIKGV